ncbi:hypothetical protein NEAUS07_2069 [Nematocida ausubeli]|nr:hypothetical protein NEAUS07_2069 [Nematocida ausubeli]
MLFQHAAHEKDKCTTYKEIISNSKSNSPENYIFEGTKLDISKSLLNRSVITVSNTDKGLSMNYTMKNISKLFSASLFGDGSVLGKILPSDGTGLSLTYMHGSSNRYFDIGYTKTFKNYSFALSAVNPDLEIPAVNFSAKEMHPRAVLGRIKEAFSAENISGLMKEGLQDTKITEKLKRKVSEVHKVVNGGIFSIASVARICPTMHIGHETIISFAKDSKIPGGETKTVSSIFGQYSAEIASTCIISKVFNTWRVLGLYHTTGPAGALIEKTLDESVSLYSEVSFDWRNILKRKEKEPKMENILQSLEASIGTTIYGDGNTTRVSAGSNGTVSVSSDISVGDGAALNLSGQISSNGPVLGIGFTFTS